MQAWFWIVFWWLAFAGTHVLLSSAAIRAKLVQRLGEAKFLGLYSLIAFATFIPLLSVYWDHIHGGPLLWQLRTLPGIEPLALLLAALGWMVIVAAVLRPPPTSVGGQKGASSHGLTRITRHPMLIGVVIWAGSHLLLHGFLNDVIFFGGFLVYALIGACHQDMRNRASRQDLDAFYAETSLLPFAAIASGRNRLVAAELPWASLVIGLLVALALLYSHRWMV